MEKKVVGYREFYFELTKLRKKYCIDGEIHITDMDGFTYEDSPVNLGISWASIGTVTPDEADVFAGRLKVAAEACRNFKYNGYIIDYSK